MESDKNLNESQVLLRNASRFLDEARGASNDLTSVPIILEEDISILNETLEEMEEGLKEIEELHPSVSDHTVDLSHRAQELYGLFSETKNLSENAIRAANAYNDISKAIADAEQAAESSKIFVDEATSSFNKLQENSTDAESQSSNLLDDAFSASQSVSDLQPQIDNALTKSRPIRSLHEENKKNLDEIEENLKQLASYKVYENDLKEAVRLAEHAQFFTEDTKLGVENKFVDVSFLRRSTQHNLLIIPYFLRYRKRRKPRNNYPKI